MIAQCLCSTGRFQCCGGTRFTRVLATIVATMLGSGVSLAAGEQPKVTITGGADDTAHNYLWIVTNHYTSPIVFIKIPHYHADMFNTPPGWTQHNTYIAKVGGEDRPGVCTASAPADQGIAPGQSIEFGMRIGGIGAKVGTGDVKIRFADGTETTVSGVVVSEVFPLDMKFVPLIGLAVIFVLVIVIRELRSRRSAAARPADDLEPPADS